MKRKELSRCGVQINAVLLGRIHANPVIGLNVVQRHDVCNTGGVVPHRFGVASQIPLMCKGYHASVASNRDRTLGFVNAVQQRRIGDDVSRRATVEK